MGYVRRDLFPELYRCVGEGEYGSLHAQLYYRNSAGIAFADRDLSSGGICIVQIQFTMSKFLKLLFMAGLFINVSYIVVPIFLMLNNGDKLLKQSLGGTFF